MSDKKRRLPRHVDGRIKVGLMPLPDFLKFLPFLILGIVNMALNFTPVTLFFTVLIVGVVGGLFCEFQNKETGWDILKDAIRYKIEGDKHFERSCKYVRESYKLIKNNVKSKK